eukprot:601836-Amphidinium_carterae.2
MPLVVNIDVVASQFLLPFMFGYRWRVCPRGTFIPEPTTGIGSKTNEPRTPYVVFVLVTW